MLKKFSKTRGFTLIELLVVIAIIGILSGIVVTSLGGQRARARDARRTSELQNIALAMQIYQDQNGRYPAALADLVTAKLLSKDPVDPNDVAYLYNGYASANWAVGDAVATCGDGTGGTTKCQGFHIGGDLETNDATLLGSDDDVIASGTGATVKGGADDAGANTECDGAGNATFCYDLKNH